MNPIDPTPNTLPSPLDGARAPYPYDSWRAPLGGEQAPADSTELVAGAWLRRHAMLLAVLWAALFGVMAAGLSTAQPWAGLRLGAVDGHVVVLAVDHDSPAEAAGLRAGWRLLAVSSPQDEASLVLEAADVIRNPDQLPSYAAWARFYERQERLSSLWAGPLVRLHVQAPQASGASVIELAPAPARPLLALPGLFWFLLLVQAVTLVATAGVLQAHPSQAATVLSALAALLLALLLSCGAVFQGRELGLPAGLFHALSVTSHTAGLGALLGLAGLFSICPSCLPGVTRWRAAAVVGLFALWALASALWWLPSPRWGCHAMLLTAVALAAVQLVRQWRCEATDARQRTVVRSLGLVWAVVLGLLALREGVSLLGGTLPLAPAWIHGAILAASAGVAMTFRGARTFGLDDWGLQALLTLGAGAGTLACYRVIVASPWLSSDMAMLVAVLLFGVVYVPLSSGIWGRSLARRGPTPRELTSGILALGLAPPADRLQPWANLLMHTLQVRHLGREPPPRELRVLNEPTVLADGHALWVPPVAGLPGFMLWSRDRGGRLFTRGDRRLAQRLSELAVQTVQARDAYVRGASDERERIADDLHDDLGAKLLSLVHASGQADAAVSLQAREALEEMRLSVRNLKAQPLPVADVLADWRAETVSRLTAAGIVVDWASYLPDGMQLMPVRTGAQLTRVLREAVSNVIRHSGGARCRVLLRVTESSLQLEVEDDGRGLNEGVVARSAGYGLPNIERRVRRLGGTHRLTTAALGGTLLMVRVPLEPLRP